MSDKKPTPPEQEKPTLPHPVRPPVRPPDLIKGEPILPDKFPKPKK